VELLTIEELVELVALLASEEEWVGDIFEEEWNI
jgi:hypothetical protein